MEWTEVPNAITAKMKRPLAESDCSLCAAGRAGVKLSAAARPFELLCFDHSKWIARDLDIPHGHTASESELAAARRFARSARRTSCNDPKAALTSTSRVFERRYRSYSLPTPLRELGRVRASESPIRLSVFHCFAPEIIETTRIAWSKPVQQGVLQLAAGDQDVTTASACEAFVTDVMIDRLFANCEATSEQRRRIGGRLIAEVALLHVADPTNHPRSDTWLWDPHDLTAGAQTVWGGLAEVRQYPAVRSESRSRPKPETGAAAKPTSHVV